MKTFEMKHVKGNTWCIMGPMLIPVYKIDDTHCILLDTGLNSGNVRDVIENTILEQGMVPSGILCTHTHFDHAGNASYFQKKYQIPVIMPMGEAEQCRTIAAIKCNLYVFTVQQIYDDEMLSMLPCQADDIIRFHQNSVTICGVKFGVVHTPGHSVDHVSYITPDRVCYAGDALLCGGSLYGAKLPYSHHMPTALDSIERLRSVDCDVFIVAHRGIKEAPFDELIDENLRIPKEALDRICSYITEPLTMDEIFRVVEEKMEVEVTTVTKLLELERFIRPFLESLVDMGRLEMSVKNGCPAYGPKEKQ